MVNYYHYLSTCRGDSVVLGTAIIISEPLSSNFTFSYRHTVQHIWFCCGCTIYKQINLLAVYCSLVCMQHFKDKKRKEVIK